MSDDPAIQAAEEAVQRMATNVPAVFRAMIAVAAVEAARPIIEAELIKRARAAADDIASRAAAPYRPKRRLKSCIEQWPECWSGDYNPLCCRFPKSCSCQSYSEEYVQDCDLEPEV